MKIKQKFQRAKIIIVAEQKSLLELNGSTAFFLALMPSVGVRKTGLSSADVWYGLLVLPVVD